MGKSDKNRCQVNIAIYKESLLYLFAATPIPQTEEYYLNSKHNGLKYL
jgi:hypothetical protein